MIEIIENGSLYNMIEDPELYMTDCGPFDPECNEIVPEEKDLVKRMLALNKKYFGGRR